MFATMGIGVYSRLVSTNICKNILVPTNNYKIIFVVLSQNVFHINLLSMFTTIYLICAIISSVKIDQVTSGLREQSPLYHKN